MVRHGRVEAIGANVQVPADAREINLTGKTIYAGFIDAYSEQKIPTERLNGSARYWNGQITPQLSGTVVAILADDNDFVRAGQPLVRLDFPHG